MDAPLLDYSVMLKNLPTYLCAQEFAKILDYRVYMFGERMRRVAHWIRVIGSGG